MGSNPVEARKILGANLQLPLRRSHLHLNLYFHSSHHLHIEFSSEHVHVPQSNNVVFSDKERSDITSEIHTLLEKAVIVKHMNQGNLFHQFLFAPKKIGPIE